MSILLTILKIIGMVLLVIIAVLLVLLIAVLFIPVRYRITANRNEGEQNAAGEAVPAHVRVRVSWLLKLVRVAFDYPEAACVKIKVLFFTIFRSDKEKKPRKKKNKKEAESKEAAQTVVKQGEAAQTEIKQTGEEQKDGELPESGKEKEAADEAEEEEKIPPKLGERIREFVGKIRAGLKNIQYTIRKIYDKIKHIISNIRRYKEVIQSESFGRAWKLCSGEVLSLLKSIRPRKIKGELLLGAGDPASTGDIMAVYGMLYPIVGNPKSRYYISLTPDFENQVIEGKLLIKGKITVFKAVKTAWKIYFNKDIRRINKMLKREAA